MPDEVKDIIFDDVVCELYLAMLLKSMTDFRLAAKNIEPEAFKELLPHNLDYYYYWYCLQPAVLKYENLVLTKHSFYAGCSAALKTLYPDDEEQRKQAVERLVALYDKLVASDNVPDHDWIVEHTRYIMQHGQVAVEIREIQAQVENKRISVEEALDDIQNLRGKMGPAKRKLVDPFELMAEDDASVEMEKTYIDWFDTHCGGGLVVNEPHTIIMPTSAGKTTLSAQIGAARAMHGKSTLIVLTEGGASKQILSKVVASVLNMPWNLLADGKNPANPLRNPKLLDEKQSLLLQLCKGSVKFVDLVDNGSGVSFEDFEAEYANALEEKFDPGLIIIDWAGLLALSLVTSGKHRDMHMALENIAVNCTRFCNKYKRPILITHQVAADTASKNGIRPVYTIQDADNCKKWANHFSTAVVSTKYDESGYGTMLFGKVRYGQPDQSIVLRRDGAKCRFLKAPPNIVFQKTRYVDAYDRGSFKNESVKDESEV